MGCLSCLLGLACQQAQQEVNVEVLLHPEYGIADKLIETRWVNVSLKPESSAWKDPWRPLMLTQRALMMGADALEPGSLATGYVPAGTYTHVFLDLGDANEADGAQRGIVDIVEPIAAPFQSANHGRITLRVSLMLRETYEHGTELQLFAIDSEVYRHD